ncbi:MAG: hypothetical protein GQ577_13815 [Woeseiaceae bacterium]|nr:hypothetical protein [Woeseiaceae bacterium]
MNFKLTLFLFFSVAMTACGDTVDSAGTAVPGDAPVESQSELVVIGEDLQQLKDDFNDNQGKVRLLFISGPTCGICLRGMADLNDEFLAASQNDERLVTFVVHVPTLGAKQHHVGDSIPLLDGPRIHHYWEETGIIGQHFTEVMDVRMYVWDFWAIYGPEYRWDGLLPPVPDYYEHQLGSTTGLSGGFPRELILNAERFAAETRKYVEELDGGQYASSVEPRLSDGEQLADGTFIPRVAQPRNVAVRQHIMGRGGYKNLKRIQSIEQRGRLEVGEKTYDLTTHASRPNHLQRNVSGAAEGDRGLPVDFEQKLLSAFEFDGLFVEWPQKQHEVSMSGMLKIGDVLAWRLHLKQNNGPEWYLYVNSHGGALVRADMLNDDGDVEYSIRQSDFRESSGITFAHRIEYLDGEGRSLGVESIDDIDVTMDALEMELEAVSH